MDKIEKLLGISVTAEMVAEQLTEQEIIEIQEELEEELNSIDNVIEISQGEKGYHQNEMKKHESAIADLDSKLKVDTQRKNLYTKVNENLKSALTLKKQGIEAKFKSGDKVVFTKSEEGLFKSGDVGVVKSSLNAYGRYIYHVETSECAFISAEEHEIKLHENELSSNKRRAELIDEAKRFVETNTKKRKIFTSVGNWYAFEYYGRSVNERFVISESKRTIKLEIVGAINPVVYKEGVVRCHLDDVWNEHIGKAIALGRILGVDISKFESAPQPAEIVEGMDVEFLSAGRGLYKRGRVKEYNEKDDYVILEDGYELGEDAKPNNVVLIASSNYRILSDTKAKYSDGDE